MESGKSVERKKERKKKKKRRKEKKKRRKLTQESSGDRQEDFSSFFSTSFMRICPHQTSMHSLTTNPLMVAPINRPLSQPTQLSQFNGVTHRPLMPVPGRLVGESPS